MPNHPDTHHDDGGISLRFSRPANAVVSQAVRSLGHALVTHSTLVPWLRNGCDHTPRITVQGIEPGPMGGGA